MDIYSALKQDHQELLGFLDELVNLSESDDYRHVLIDQIKSELVPHARAEESVFYNSIRAASDNTEVMHSFKEHMEAETLLRNLQLKDSVSSENWKETAVKLKEAIEHHISEEENKIFTEGKKLFSDEEAKMMGEAFEKLKAKVSQDGFIKSSFDMVVNLMPPRFVNKVRELGSSQTSGMM